MFVLGEDAAPEGHGFEAGVFVYLLQEVEMRRGEEMGHFGVMLGDVPAKVVFEPGELVSIGELPYIVYAGHESIDPGAVPRYLFV